MSGLSSTIISIGIPDLAIGSKSSQSKPLEVINICYKLLNGFIPLLNENGTSYNISLKDIIKLLLQFF